MKPSLYQPPAHIIDYDKLAEKAKYSWVNDFIAQKELQAKLNKLNNELKRVRVMHPLKADFLRRLKENYAKIEARRKEGLVAALMEYRHELQPLRWWQQRMRSGLHHWMDRLPPLEEFEEAVSKMPEGEISDADRQKAIEKLEKEIKGAEDKLKQIEKNELLVLTKNYVENWRYVQQKVNAPCNPFGIDLNKSEKAEKDAWKKLGLDRFVSPRAPYLVHYGRKY